MGGRVTAIYILLIFWFGISAIVGPIMGKLIAWGEE